MRELIRTLRGAVRVWQRNRDVYLVTWKTNMVPPLTEPLLYLLAFGYGVGMFLGNVNYGGREVPYIAFIAPGLMASGLMFHTFFENTYNTFVRMYYQKTFDALLTTPIGLRDLVIGEFLWGATKGSFAATLMMVAITVLQAPFLTGLRLLSYPAALWIVPFSFLAGFMFATIAVCFAAVAPRIDTLNLPTFLFITPMFLFSGVFFPLEALPAWAQQVARFLPLTHVVRFMRDAALGRLGTHLAVDAGWMIVFLLPTLPLGIYLMRRRVIR